MMKLLSLFLLMFAAPLLGQNGAVESIYSAQEIEQANTAKDANYLSEEEKKFVCYLNLVKLDPQRFCSQYFEPFIKEHPELRSSYSASLIRTLKRTKPMQLIAPNELLTEQAKDHAINSGRTGHVGHKGFSNRAKSVKPALKDIFEANSYGDEDALGFLINLLIDEDVSSLGHRKILLDPNLSLIGLHIADHKRYRRNIVTLFGNPGD